MKTFPPAMAAKLAAGATTFCRCWRIVRRDGVRLGFTDHDVALSVDGTDCLPAGGFTATADSATGAMAAGGSDIEGALAVTGLNEEELAAGLFDGAEITVMLVDWTAPDAFVVTRRGTLGEVSFMDGRFRAEIRGPAQELAVVRGRVFAADCDADFGDGRCGVDADDPAFRIDAAIAEGLGPQRFRIAGAHAFAAGWFTHGRARFTDGANAGFASAIKHHAREPEVVVELWSQPPYPPDPGDQVTLVAGCDKRFATCSEKFSNTLNFRGFPQIPGNAFALSYPPHPSGENDGGPLV
jgi:uncharacterized phage protein (TIGR02218 family)